MLAGFVMVYSVQELKDFYGSRAGRLVKRMLSAMIYDLWPDVKPFFLCGYGYTPPFIRRHQKEAQRVCFFMPERNNVHFWPENKPGQVCLTSDKLLPLETESVDRLIVVHGLEYAEDPDMLMQEFWRVLKSNGRILVIVPNRLGLWARAEWTPFGHGTPYTTGQLLNTLKNNLFVVENSRKALFMPPFKSFIALRTVYFFESFGRFVFSGLAGVHLVEASKQVYAGKTKKVLDTKGGRRYALVGTVSS